MQDATYLTDEKYPGKESELWTPCIYDFFYRYKPMLSVSTCIHIDVPNSALYTSRKQSRFLKIEGDMYIEPSPNQILYKIADTFDRNLMFDKSSRSSQNGDITGIDPDIVIILPRHQGVLLIENKPYGDSSKFGGNQGPDGAYVKFVKWLNGKGISCQYLVIMPIAWPKGENKVRQLCENLQNNFGVLLLEHIFTTMSTHNFRYEIVKENWRDFSDTVGLYAEVI